MNVQVLPQRSDESANATQLGIADCDIHPTPKSVQKEVFPFLEKRWQEHYATYGMLRRQGYQSGPAYPKGQPDAARRDAYPPGGGRPGSDLAFMREHHLDPHNIQFGVLNPLSSGQGLQNADFAAAYCAAINDWQIAEWTSKEPRLKGSVVINYEDAVSSAAEIDRRAGDRNFAQVMLLSRSAEPLGNRRYWPIYEAAERYNLPIGFHVFGTSGHPVSGAGWPSYYIEEGAGHSTSCQTVVTSLVIEGVFERFPKLKVVMIEGGFAWAPALAFRLDKLFERMRGEVPHLKRRPSEYIRDHVYFTTQPMEEPDDRRHVLDVMEWIGWDKLLFASDYPHWDFDDPFRAFPAGVTPEQHRRICTENGKSVFRIN